MSHNSNKPIYWKQVLVTISTVYPLIIGSDLLLKTIFPMHVIRPEIALFCTVIIVAALMVYPVMPIAEKYLGNWLKRK